MRHPVERALRGRSGVTIAELMVVAAVFAFMALLFVPALGRAREASRRAACVNNLKQMGFALKMYGSESPGGKWPTVATYYDEEVDCFTPGAPSTGIGGKTHFFWNPDQVYPDYLNDFTVIVCPSDKEFFIEDLESEILGVVDITYKCQFAPRGWSMLNNSYAYYGHVFDKLGDDPAWGVRREIVQEAIGFFCTGVPPGGLVSLQPLLAFVYIIDTEERLRPTVADRDYEFFPLPEITDEPVGNGDTNTLFRLREGVERFLITDINNAQARAEAQSGIPVMWDHTSTLPAPAGFNHLPGGTNVLFMDGRVEFVVYPGIGPTSVQAASFEGCLEDS
jgi:prepilin-type processing-associated H-X9-DG protein